MTIGTSIVLIAIGAILKWAVTAHVSGINLETVGTILFVLGILGLVLSLLYMFAWSPRRHPVDETRVAHRPPAPDDRYY
jgi:heme/copper-type cytochrome/quinol oxidase subunit 2